MKQVYLVKQNLDDPHYPAKVVAVYASEASAQKHVDAYEADCAKQSRLPLDHEFFWDYFESMYVMACELGE